MLSYQHAYHAGNLADVHKHIALSTLWQLLTQKPRGVSYVETHAGRGLYHQDSGEALKTGEFSEGIARYHGGSVAFDDVLAKIRAQYGDSAYPGSPLIVSSLARDVDKLVFAELHPQEVKALRTNFRAQSNVKIHQRDGIEMALALAPMTPRKGLIHIDPSYEVKTEYSHICENAKKLLRKWPEATIMIWYPRLAEGRHHALMPLLKLRGALHAYAEFLPNSKLRMKGTGLIFLNAPYGTKQALETSFSSLTSLFAKLAIDESKST